MRTFDQLYAHALDRKGEEALAARLPSALSADEIRAESDDRFLAAMSRCVFAAGFRWRVIDAKWPGFELAFHEFDPGWVASQDADGIEVLRHDTRIVRNPQKIVATVENARFVREIASEHGAFADWIADWPADDLVGLWTALKKRGARLGGLTGPRFLRMMGKDTFLLSPDVVRSLIEQGIVTKQPSSKRDLGAAQAAFAAWAAQSGRPLCEISMIVACTV